MEDDSRAADTVELDGNAIAGQLAEVFSFDAMTARLTCRWCGAEHVLAEARVFPGGPGTVMRCRSCAGVQLRLARSGDRLWLDMSGVQTLSAVVPASPAPDR